MRTRDVVQPTFRSAVDSMTSGNADDVSTNSSAIIALTVLADAQDVLAVVRTGFLLARSLHAPLSVNVLGREISSVHVGDSADQLTLSGVLDSVQRELCDRAYDRTRSFVLEASVIAASFVSAGSISVRIRAANSGS